MSLPIGVFHSNTCCTIFVWVRFWSIFLFYWGLAISGFIMVAVAVSERQRNSGYIFRDSGLFFLGWTILIGSLLLIFRDILLSPTLLHG